MLDDRHVRLARAVGCASMARLAAGLPSFALVDVAPTRAHDKAARGRLPPAAGFVAMAEGPP